MGKAVSKDAKLVNSIEELSAGVLAVKPEVNSVMVLKVLKSPNVSLPSIPGRAASWSSFNTLSKVPSTVSA